MSSQLAAHQLAHADAIAYAHRRVPPEPRPVSTLGALAEHHEERGTLVIWDTPDHHRDPTLRIYERYTGLEGQERFGLVDPAGRVFHYDALEISWIAQR